MTSTLSNFDLQKKDGALWSLLSLSGIVYLVYAAVTHWVVEDALITARIARNFAEHNVLSFNKSSILSSATSPLYALMLGVFAKMGLEPILIARVFGCMSILGASTYMYSVAKSFFSKTSAILAGVFYLLYPSTVAYSLAGLETPIYSATCLMALFLAIEKYYRKAGVFAALSAVLRPDGVLVWGVVLLMMLFEKKSWKERAKDFMPGVAMLGIYAAAHFLYYDSWVPFSMVAKGAVYEVQILQNIQSYLSRMFLSQPPIIGFYLVAIGGGIIACRRDKRFLWLAVWYAIYHIAFMSRAALFSWYLRPPEFVLTFFGAIAVASFLTLKTGPKARVSMIVVLVAGLLFLNIQFGKSKRTVQSYEDRVRKAASQWLQQNANPEELVFTESLGYVGYYNQNPFVDWPGLVDRDVPDLVRNLSQKKGYEKIITTKKPVYLVLRFREWEQMDEAVTRLYREVIRFESPYPDSDVFQGYVICKQIL